MDISRDMLDVAVERETEGELLLGDLGQARWRPGFVALMFPLTCCSACVVMMRRHR